MKAGPYLYIRDGGWEMVSLSLIIVIVVLWMTITFKDYVLYICVLDNRNYFTTIFESIGRAVAMLWRQPFFWKLFQYAIFLESKESFLITFLSWLLTCLWSYDSTEKITIRIFWKFSRQNSRITSMEGHVTKA